MKYLKFGLILLFLSFGQAVVFFPSTSEAATGTCFFTGTGGPVAGTGSCSTPSRYGAYGTNDVLTGRSTGGSGSAIPASVNTKSEFITFINNRFNSSNDHDKIGAAFIIQELRSNTDRSWPSTADVNEWRDLMNQSDVSVTRGWDGSVGRTSYYDAAKKNTFYGAHPTVGREVIYIRQGGALKAEIEVLCGNMVAGALAVPPPSWTLDGDSFVGAGQKEVERKPGATVPFKHYVKNTGPDDMDKELDARVVWVRVTGPGPTEGNVWYPTNGSGAKLQCHPDRLSQPDGLDVGGAARSDCETDFTVPAGAKANDLYCQRIEFRPKTRGDSAWRTHDNGRACIKVIEDAESWDIDGTSTVSSSTAPIGGSVTFTHRVWNKGPDKSDVINGRVYQTKNGGTPTLVSAAYDYSKDFRDTSKYPGDDHRPSYGFPIPAGSVDGDIYCHYITWNKESPTKGAGSTKAQNACVEVTAPAGKNVKIVPQMTATSLIETGGAATFTGSSTVSEYPSNDSSKKEWGYTQQSKQLAAVRQSAYVKTNPVQQGPDQTTTGTANYSCPSGGTRSGTKCNVPAKYGCVSSPGAKATSLCPKDKTYAKTADAYSYDASVSYSCPAGYSGGGSSSVCSRPTYRCAQTGGAYSPTYPSGCKTEYACPGGANGGGWYNSAPLCDAWKCQYGDAVQRNQVNAPTCQARCNNGTASLSSNPLYPGIAPHASQGGYDSAEGYLYNTGDTNCYILPAFTLSCTWTKITVYRSDGSIRSGPSNQAGSSQTVDGNGPSRCSATLNVTSTNIGDRICATYKPTKPTGWLTSPYVEPGRTGGSVPSPWGFRVEPSEVTQCVRVVGAPYMRVIGGDIGVGAGADATCTTDVGANIRGRARPGNIGSAAGVAVLAPGPITDFGSGQFAASPPSNNSIGVVPRAVTFANDSGTYGGNFGATTACVNTASFEPSGSVNLSDTADDTIGLGQVVKIQANGDVYINANVRYAAYSSVATIPSFQLVATGNIYISGSVTQLDGVYVSTNGSIYTCSDGTNAVSASWQNNVCSKQLVVNGAFVADRVYLGRDCGSLKYAYSNEPTVFDGGTNAEQCQTGSTKSAEVFNFLPEQWIKAGLNGPSDTYDSITNMPPIL